MISRQGLDAQVASAATSLRYPADLDPVLDRIGDAHYVLIGEASHGTSEFYTWREALSRRLIEQKRFDFIAVEGDWPDCYRVNRYVKGYPDAGESAYDVLHAFERWPTWMWANWEVTAFTDWLRQYNVEAQQEVGFYGLDVYSLWESMEAIIDYLEVADPEAVPTAKDAYLCFEPYGKDAQTYAMNTAFTPDDCADEVVDLLVEMRKHTPHFDGDTEAAFSADQNALVTVNAERYYRAMIRGGADSWNVRDRHMMETLDRLMDYHGDGARGIVWAHNTHVGDARATDMARRGMVNIGQLALEAHRDNDVVLVGFGSQRGSVIAGSEWGAPMEVMPMPPAQSGNWEDILHGPSPEDKLLVLDALEDRMPWMETRGHRAIGVVYHPEWETGNYVPTVLPQRYNAFLFIDQTEALHPLHISTEEQETLPETYPWGF